MDWGFICCNVVPFWSVAMKNELSHKAKLSIYWSVYVLTLTNGHEVPIITKRTKSRIEIDLEVGGELNVKPLPLGRGMSGAPSWTCCPRDPISDKRKTMD
ncbi:hypothetical protein CRENBAI_003471 [Crenichthys baileyi]|uniref:Uncharacterized protein n=1 Tax=Crenichthys baileyi TaxID=28760 RepID=A0AAV9RE67_9TELE